MMHNFLRFATKARAFLNIDKKKALPLLTLVAFIFIFGRSTLQFFFKILANKLLMIILLLLLIVGILFYQIKPIWFRNIGNLFKLFLIRVTVLLKKSLSLVQTMAMSWIQKFKYSSRNERWEMIKRPIFIIVAIMLIARFGNLFLPPKVYTSFPGNESLEASLDSKVEVIFDRGVIKSLAENSFSISPELPGSFSWEGDQKLIFIPERNFDRATSYTVTFKGLVLSKYLIPLLGDKSITFETIGNPKIMLASPQIESFEDLTPVTVVFDRPMIPLTTATNTELKQPAFTIKPELSGEGRWLGTTAYQFRPSEPFKKATTYEVVVPAGMKSQDEGVLQEDYTWQFSSERPRIIDDISPKRDYIYASPTASISATFNQEIVPESIQGRSIVADESENKISGQIKVNKNVVGFYPSQPLKRGSRFTATILEGVSSTEGPNGMENDYTWSFAVADFPEVISSKPVSGSENVDEVYSLGVTFKTPMDQESFKNNITIEPQPSTDPSFYFSSYGSQNTLTISTYLQRSASYKITIGAGVTDQYGVALGSPYTFSFTTAAYSPSISMYPSGTYFGAFNQEVVPRVIAKVTNANKVDYSLYKLEKEDLLELYRRRYSGTCSMYDKGCSNWQSYDPSQLKKINVWSESYDIDLNVPVNVITKITTESGENLPSGFYFLDMEISDGVHDNMVMIVSKSTLTIKKSENQIFTWAVNQASGEVVPGMKMELIDLNGNTITEGVSNDDGVFMQDVDLFHKNDLFVFGQTDDDIVVAASAWSQGINRYDFGLPSYYDSSQRSRYTTRQDYKLFLTLDRPIYRPGQQAYFKGVVKKDNDGAYENLEPGEMVSVKILDSQNKSVFSQQLPTTTFGSYSGDFVLSDDAQLGYYRVESTFRGTTHTQQFQVEEYKKPEVAVSVESSREAYSQGDIANISVNASYYFGAPVSDAPLTWALQTQDSGFRWDKDWRFEFGDPDSYWSRPWWYYSGSSYYSGSKVTEGLGTTDAKGDFQLDLPLDISKHKTSQRMLVEATVNDNSNQSIAASREFTVHKSSLYVGLRPTSYSNRTGQEARAEVVVVDLAGNEVGNTPVSIEIYKRTWDTVREKNPDDGVFYYVSKPSDALVTSMTVTTDSIGRAIASFVPTEGGTYKIIGRVTDSKGNQNISGSFFWVSGYGFSAARENNDRIVLITDKRDYLVGEEASIFVASPYASESATTLLTAERGNVLDYQVVKTDENSNNFKMSIPPRYTPNAFIGAVLVRAGDQVKKPAEFKMGYSEIKVTDQKQQIAVKVKTDKSNYKPGEKLRATVETKDLLGHPISTELAVGLVDEAVWDLSSVEMPDIYKTFYQPRNLDVATSQLLTISIDRINANTNLGAKGGSGGGCFTGDTQILMKEDGYKNIEDIKIGDVVLTRASEKSPNLVEAKVTNTFKHDVDEYLIVNGELRVTSIHRMFINGEWKTAGLLEVGDYLLDKDDQPVRVFSIERVSGNFEVYNLEIDKYRTYFAGDIYVHNQKGDNDTSRSDFPDTAYWNPTLTTNSEGKAEIEIQLPDNLTTWRLSAIANSADSAFGSSTSEVIVSRDILVRPFLPRFLSIGDKAQLGAIIVNTSGTTKRLTAKIESNGIKITDSPTREFVLASGDQEKITWPTEAENVTAASVSLYVESDDGSAKDSVTISLPVRSSSIPEVVATSGKAMDSATEKLVLPSDIDQTQGEASVSISPSLGGDVLTALPSIFASQYYGSEQVASRILPATLTYRVFTSAGIDGSGSTNTEHLSAVIVDGIQRLNAQQHMDGGWGWWSEFSSDPFITAYAFYAMSEAKNDGFEVADQTLERSQAYLENQLSRATERSSLNTQAYILYVLKDRDTNISSFASNMYDRRFELSLEGRAYLAMAMKDMPGMSGKARRIHDELLGFAKKTATTTHWEESGNNYRFMGSNTTTTATILETISHFNKKNPLIPEIVRYLQSIRINGHWASTRDTAAVSKAIAFQLLENGDQKVSEDYRLELDNNILAEGNFSNEDLLTMQAYSIPVSDLNIGGESDLKITKSGAGNLYYNINLKYFLPFTEIEPLEQGIVVVREFIDSKGNILPSNFIEENSEVWVRLIIVAPEERHYLAIEDVLPAGLESVNESLNNVSSLNNEQPTRLAGNQSLYFQHKEYHDDRTTLFANYLPAGVYELTYRVRATTPGLYQHPPAQAYQMYLPDISGHSSGGWIEVR